MKSLAFAVIALALGATSARAADDAPQLKGMAEISQELSARIATREEPFELDRFMPADGLDELAGTWADFGAVHHFTNGTPNPVNMVIMHASLSGFAEAMGKSCREPTLELNDNFADTLEDICAWPKPAAKTDAVMSAFWLALMGYEAPKEEYVAWRDFFLASSYRDRPATEAVAAMTLAITMNPYFLISK
ncbi:MAG: hypothetical protein U1E67_12030 [Hyphomicrobiales bacterium]